MRLGVNIDHVATLRQARGVDIIARAVFMGLAAAVRDMHGAFA